MKKLKFIVLIVVCFSTSVNLVAQKKAGLVAKGDKRFDDLAYSKALPYYLKYSEKHESNNEVKLKIGDCYRLMNVPQSAEKWYGEGLASGSQIYRFYYASAIMQNERFADAASEFEKFLKANPGNELAQQRLTSCRNYRSFYGDSGRAEITNVSINTEGADFSPVYYGDKVVVSSDREDGDFLFAWLSHHFLDIFETEMTDEMDIINPKRIKGLVNSKYHEASASFSPSGDTLYFTRNTFYKGKASHDKEGTLLLQTYSAIRNGEKWTKITPMDFNNTEYSSGHPAVFANGSKMIIVSDRPGSIGGTDLFLVNYSGGLWKDPIPLSSVINTKENEMFPWVSPNGDLFFASNGHPGLGGLDVFMCKWENGSWGKPVNLGFPINTSMDDFGFVMNEEGSGGFFSSNRSGGMGDDDIYSFVLKRKVIVNVIEAGTRKPISNEVAKIMVQGSMEGYLDTDETGVGNLYLNSGYDHALMFDPSDYEKKEVVVKPASQNPFEPTTLIVELKKKVNDCNPTATLDGTLLATNNQIPEGANVTIRSKETGLEIRPNMKFDYNMELGKDYVVEVTTPGRKPLSFDINTNGVQPNDTVPLLIDLTLAKADIGKVFYIIYYNFDKHDIRQDASTELNDMVTFLKKNPTVKVELTSHTDERGTVEYNQTLSKNRATEAFDYIVKNGISRDRLSFKWKGESEPANPCVNPPGCDEAGHQLNRRTEFRLIGL